MLSRLHYQVSFLHEGELRYGTAELHTKDAKEAAERGELMVADAVLPKRWIIDERFILDVPIESGEYERYVQKELDRATAISDGLEGCVKGRIMRFQVGRGYAFYLITKVTKTLVHLEWRGYSLDRWIEPVLGYFGKMSRARAEAMIRHEDQYQRRSDLD